MALAVLFSPGSAVAACARPTPEAAVRHATVVFTGVVTSATAGKGSFVNAVRVDRLYRGQVTSADVRVRTTGGECGLGALTRGERYVVMATPDGDSWLAGPRSGTVVATDALLVRIRSLLGAGTAQATTSTPRPVDYQQIGSASPRSFLRFATPGFVLIGVGLLGWAGLTVIRSRA